MLKDSLAKNIQFSIFMSFFKYFIDLYTCKKLYIQDWEPQNEISFCTSAPSAIYNLCSDHSYLESTDNPQHDCVGHNFIYINIT